MQDIMQTAQSWLATHVSAWGLFGLFGQSMFMMRFIYQWIYSERAKKVVVPEIFWYFSAGGSLMVMIYAIHKQDLVFILSQAALPIYFRNIYLIWKHKKVPKDV